MLPIRRSLIVLPALIFILACQLVSTPLQQVEDGAATAAAFATDIEDISTQFSGIATEFDDLATQAIGLATDVVGASTPVGPGTSSPALDVWNEIPIMPGALSTSNLGTVYQYTIKTTPDEIEKFYRSRLVETGWEEFFSAPYTDGTGAMTFTRDTKMLIVTYTDNHDGTMLILLTLG